jgi:hypothetical protein
MNLSNPIYKLNLKKRIADPVHGLIRLTEIESKILEQPIFQRLRNITQLGMAKYVYPGATHSRFSHSLGVVHNVNLMYNAAYTNCIRKHDILGDVDSEWIFSDDLLQITRIAALCHDIGHFPFSHNLEPSFDWLETKGITSQTFRHEEMSVKIVEQLLEPIIGENTKEIISLISGNLEPKFLFPGMIISSAIDADRMDYLVRDSLNSGVDHGRFDKERLLDSIYPYHLKIKGVEVDSLAFASKGIEAVEQFLLARHRMHQTIYFNPSVVGFEAGLKRAYYRISTENPPWKLPTEYMEDVNAFIDFDESLLFLQLKQAMIENKSWLMDPIINRKPLSKVGPYYYTVQLEAGNNADEDSPDNKMELFNELRDLENPADDWYQSDHWMYVENKSQTLIKSISKLINQGYNEFNTMKEMKNGILLIDGNGKIIDPTDISFGHTFLPYIAGREYNRLLLFTEKNNSDKLNKLLTPINDRLEKNQISLV